MVNLPSSGSRGKGITTLQTLGLSADEQRHRYFTVTIFIILSWLCISLQSLFTKGLSQRIRHLRHNEKRKSGGVGQKGGQSRPCFTPLASTSAMDQATSAEDVQRHLVELQKEWSKPEKNRNGNHIKLIIEQTKDYLTDLLKQDESGRIAPILEVYPCFQEGCFVSKHLTTLQWTKLYCTVD